LEKLLKFIPHFFDEIEGIFRLRDFHAFMREYHFQPDKIVIYSEMNKIKGIWKNKKETIRVFYFCIDLTPLYVPIYVMGVENGQAC